MKIKNVKEKAKKVGLISTMFVTLFGAVNVVGPRKDKVCDEKDVSYSQVNELPDQCSDQPDQPQEETIIEETVVEETKKNYKKPTVEPKRKDTTPKAEEVIVDTHENDKEVEVKVEYKEENVNFEYEPEVVITTQEDYNKIQVIVDNEPEIKPVVPTVPTVEQSAKGSQGEEIYVSPSDLEEAQRILSQEQDDKQLDQPIKEKEITGDVMIFE